MATVVRPLAATSIAFWTICSEVLSREDVASSRRLVRLGKSKTEEDAGPRGWVKVVDLQNLGVTEKRTSYGNTLPLASG
jgi:hypothetical protein